jgi:drug/metabolite transporter (DMT)-like permease
MKAKDWLLFWLLGIIWGTSFLWIKIAVTEISPFMLVSFRTLFALLGLGVFLLLVRSARAMWGEVRKRLWVFIVLGLFNIVIPWLLISWAGQYIDSGLSSILNSTMPLFTIVISPFFVPDDRFTLKKAAGLLTGFAGVVILLYPNIGEAWSNHLAGQAAVLFAALGYGGSTVFARKMAKGLPPHMQAFLQFFSATVMIWAFTLATQRPLVFPRLPITWLALLWLGLLGSGLAYIIYFDLLPRIGPTRMSMVTYILPLVGVLLGIIFLEERFYWGAIIGALLILSGITIVNVRPSRKKEPSTVELTNSGR